MSRTAEGRDAAGQPAPAGDPRQLLAAASLHHREGRLAEAEAGYLALIRALPEAPEPHRRLGILYGQSGRAERAAEAIGRAVALAPDNAVYRNDLGHACLAARRLDAAAEAYGAAIRLQPGQPEGHFNLGGLLHQQGRLEAAIACYRRALEIEPSAFHVLLNLGVALQEFNEYEEAVAVLRRASELDPRSFGAHYNLGLVLAIQRRFDEAIASYRRALEIEPEAAAAYVNYGHALQEQRRTEEALAAYRKAVALDPDLPQAQINLASVLHELGALDESLAALKRAIALDPSDPQSLANLAQTLLELGEFGQAEGAFRRALALKPGYVAALAHFAIFLQRIGKRDEAERLLDYPLLLRTRTIARPEGWPDLAAFNAALADSVYRHPTLLADPPNKATRHGSQTMELFNGDQPCLAALKAIIEAEVADYLATALAAGRHEGIGALPARWRVHGWGVVLRSSGHQRPHYHPDGIASGVYYVRIPAAVKAGRGEAGFIKFGQPVMEAPDGALMIRTIRPEEGKLVIFPAYFWHHTIPFESDEDRISIAFDVLPAPAA